MAKYGSDEVKIEVDNDGGTAQDMSEYIDEVNEISIEALTQESTAFGDEWMKHLATGIKQGNPITFEGFFDDTATTGPDAVFNSVGDEHEIEVTYDGDTGSATNKFDAIVIEYALIPTAGELIRYRVEFQPTGTMNKA